MNLYEGMFLLNSAEAKRDWVAISGHVTELLKKHGAEILKEVHWDDRKLAYDLGGQKRGTYFLVFFKLDPLKLATLRRDCQLSEIILRQLFIRHQGSEVPSYPLPVHESGEGDAEAGAGAGDAVGARPRREASSYVDPTEA